MIVRITDEVISNAIIEGAWVGELEDLSSRGMQGKHFVIASRESLKELSKWEKMSDRASAFFRYQLNKYAFLAQVSEKCSFGIDVVLEGEGVIENQGWYSIPIEILRESGEFLETQMVVENYASDGRLYFQLGRIGACQKFGAGVSVSLDIRNGGGASTPTLYNDLVQEKRAPVLGICDSDKKAPEGRCGSHVSGMKRVFLNNRNRWPVCLHVLNVNEAENIIALSLLEKYAETIDKVDEFDRLIEIKSHWPDALCWLDLKEGVCYQDILDKETGAAKAYLKERFEFLFSRGVFVSECCDECCNEKECQRKSREICSAKIGGFGTNVVVGVTDILNRMTPHKVQEAVCSEDFTFLKDWQDIMDVVSQWGVAHKPMRV